MKSEKRQTMEGIELPNQEGIRNLGEKENTSTWNVGSEHH